MKIRFAILSALVPCLLGHLDGACARADAEVREFEDRQPTASGAPRTPPCLGYDAERKQWGMLVVNSVNPEQSCPADSALMFHVAALGPELPPANSPVMGSCCPVPSGALTRHHRYFPLACPPDAVVTGARIANREQVSRSGAAPEYELRCTTIDASRFRLGPATPAVEIEYGRENPVLRAIGFSSGLKITGWNMIPSDIRYGLGRLSATRWTNSGCVGIPWRSLLSQVGRRWCRGVLFRELIPIDQTETTRAESRACALARLTDPDARCESSP